MVSGGSEVSIVEVDVNDGGSQVCVEVQAGRGHDDDVSALYQLCDGVGNEACVKRVNHVGDDMDSCGVEVILWLWQWV